MSLQLYGSLFNLLFIVYDALFRHCRMVVGDVFQIDKQVVNL